MRSLTFPEPYLSIEEGINNPILRRRADEIFDFTAASGIRTLARSMLRTMHHYHGVGLAAPQVGKSVRLIVWEMPFQTGPGSGPFEMINPVIVTRDKRTKPMPEGCLSLPGVEYVVERSVAVAVRWRSHEGGNQGGSFLGISARIIQHEIDHLDGILIRDREQ